MNVIIVGSGAVAAELTSYIEDHNSHVDVNNRMNILGYLDFEENISKYWSRYKLEKPVLGDVHSYNIERDDHFIVAISDIAFREKILNILESRLARITGFLHYNSIIAKSANIGTGNIIYPYCIIGPNAIIGKNNLITSYSFISHDCKVGDNNFFSTAGLSGNVNVGNRNYFGIRSTVLPHVSIGDSNVVQAGMIVDKDVSNNSIIFYRYKEKLIAIKSPTGNE
jgi:acetyltransferase-like isoleucine patch superfamily enzyme